MIIEQFSVWVIICISFASSVLISNIWYIYFKKVTLRNEKTDNGLLFLSLAIAMWFISGIATKLYPVSIGLTDVRNSFFSTINNIFLLLGAGYLEFSPAWIKHNKIQAEVGFTNFIAFGTLVFFSTLILHYSTINLDYVKIPDFLFSLITVIVLLQSFPLTFWKRKLKLLAVFSFITLLILLIAQPIPHFFTNSYKSDGFILIGLCGRICFIMVICLLAYSWSQENFSKAQIKVSKLTVEVSSLKKEVKHKEETASKDEREAAWQDIAMKAAHKIGNPIEAIDRYNKTLQIRLEKKDLRESKIIQSHIHESVRDAKYVLSEFKSLTKLTQIRPQSCDLVKLIRQAIRSGIEENDVKFEIDVHNLKLKLHSIKLKNHTVFLTADESIILNVDRDKVKQCFTELIANSMHFFNKAEKKIHVAVEIVNDDLPEELIKEKDFIRITYSDNGSGVKKEHKKNIFNPFVTTYQHGSGLGLSIVKRIIELHGGTIFENGNYMEGAKFEMYFPLM